MNTIQKLHKENLKTTIPTFGVGDTIKVDVLIVEGDKERTQAFSGVVIARKGTGIAENITVRRVAHGYGVERIFPLHSPRVAKIEVTRQGKTRRAKLYYLRTKIGKSARVKERRTV